MTHIPGYDAWATKGPPEWVDQGPCNNCGYVEEEHDSYSEGNERIDPCPGDKFDDFREMLYSVETLIETKLPRAFNSTFFEALGFRLARVWFEENEVYDAPEVEDEYDGPYDTLEERDADRPDPEPYD